MVVSSGCTLRFYWPYSFCIKQTVGPTGTRTAVIDQIDRKLPKLTIFQGLLLSQNIPRDKLSRITANGGFIYWAYSIFRNQEPIFFTFLKTP